MVFKHGLIPLEVHSWLTANLSVTLGRMRGYDVETQSSAWFFGLTHDAGVLSLQKDFDHSHVEEGEVRLLLEIVERRYGVRVDSPEKVPDMVEFAHYHALSHIRKFRREARRRLEERFGKGVAECVIEADGIATGRERLGYQKEVLPIFRSFTTKYAFNTPFRRHNIACFLEHTVRMEKFRELLRMKAEEIKEDLKIPCYDPLVSESSQAIEYYLSERDNEAVEGEFRAWLDGRKAKDLIKLGSWTIRSEQKNPSMKTRCFLCGNPGRFYKGIGDDPQVRMLKKSLKEKGVKGPESKIRTGRGDVSRILGFELDTWRGEFDGRRVQYQDHRFGICDDCATALNNNQPTLEGALVYIPRPDDVYELYPEIIYRRRLREWEEWSREGRCSPDPSFFDLAFWKGTSEYSETLRGLDERRAKYERSLEIFYETLKALGAELHGVYGIASFSREFIERLKGAKTSLAPISYGCIKPSRIENVVVNGFTFQRDVAVQALRLIEAGVKLDPSLSLTENLELIIQRVDGLSLEDLDLIVSNYERIVEAVSM
jgi:hypothetical protein